jgi:hypothetical protein
MLDEGDVCIRSLTLLDIVVIFHLADIDVFHSFAVYELTPKLHNRLAPVLYDSF